MALMLHDHTAVIAGERTHRQVIRECPGRHENRRLLPEQLGAGRLKLRHDAILRVVVLNRPAIGGDDGQQRRVVLRREGQTVVRHVH